MCYFTLTLKFVSYILARIVVILGDNQNYMPPMLVPSTAKRITTQILVTKKLNGRKNLILRVFVCDIIHPSE